MIYKKDLLEGIEDLIESYNELDNETYKLSSEIAKLKQRLKKLEAGNVQAIKTNKEVESSKSKKAKSQPRDKSGKFAKKK